MTQQKSMGMSEWLMLIILSVLWGGSFFFMKLSLDELPIFSTVFSRVALASIALLLFLKFSGDVLPTGKSVWLTFFVMGFINNIVPFSLLIWGMTEIASGLAAILNATTPIFAILVAHFATSDERISVNKLFGVMLGLSGVVALIGLDALDGFSGSLLAMLACLGASFSYGLAATYGRKFKEMKLKPVSVAFGQVTASSMMLLPIALLIDNPWTLPLPGIQTWSALLALGVFSTALAYVLYFRILANAGATNIALVTLLVPVSAIWLGWFILDETLSINHFIGMTLIALGLLAIDGRIWPKRRLAVQEDSAGRHGLRVIE
jgi:drug/metabolite transporter (DMT)-like permease